jgi:hypothetical protein
MPRPPRWPTSRRPLRLRRRPYGRVVSVRLRQKADNKFEESGV